MLVVTVGRSLGLGSAAQRRLPGKFCDQVTELVVSGVMVGNACAGLQSAYQREYAMRFAFLILAASLLHGCGSTCGPCKDKLDACVASCDADYSGCINDCATTTNVSGCEDTCDADLTSCNADCDVDVNECEALEC